jgi:Flp pilus assembly protein CpaB
MRTRGIAVGLALLLAVAATGAVYLYVRNVREDARTAVTTVSMVVSTQDIAVGTTLDPLIQQGVFTTKEFPSESLVAGAVTSLTQLQGQTVSSPIFAGEQIPTSRLGSGAGGELGGGILNIPPGFVAVTVDLDASENVAGFVRKGDRVTVLGLYQDAVITLFPEVLVLSNTGAASTTAGASSGAGLVTLALRPGDAQKVALVSESGGRVWLNLLPPGQKGQPHGVIRKADLLQ